MITPFSILFSFSKEPFPFLLVPTTLLMIILIIHQLHNQEVLVVWPRLLVNWLKRNQPHQIVSTMMRKIPWRTLMVGQLLFPLRGPKSCRLYWIEIKSRSKKASEPIMSSSCLVVDSQFVCRDKELFVLLWSHLHGQNNVPSWVTPVTFYFGNWRLILLWGLWCVWHCTVGHLSTHCFQLLVLAKQRVLSYI